MISLKKFKLEFDLKIKTLKFSTRRKIKEKRIRSHWDSNPGSEDQNLMS